MSKNKKRIIFITVISLVLAAIVLNVIWVVIGFDYSGPYKGLAKTGIINKYNSNDYQGNTIFYGASNFARWDEMEEDLKPYKVQNHAFGGSTDKDLVDWADELLYPYNPKIVFFQTGSNDYILSNKATEAEKVKESMDYKKEMFSLFHEKMPDTVFVVMSGLLLPGRSEYTDMTLDINAKLNAYCSGLDYMEYIDTEALTYNREATTYYTYKFVSDGIHLTHDARVEWADMYIIPMLARLDAPKND